MGPRLHSAQCTECKSCWACDKLCVSRIKHFQYSLLDDKHVRSRERERERERKEGGTWEKLLNSPSFLFDNPSNVSDTFSSMLQ